MSRISELSLPRRWVSLNSVHQPPEALRNTVPRYASLHMGEDSPRDRERLPPRGPLDPGVQRAGSEGRGGPWHFWLVAQLTNSGSIFLLCELIALSGVDSLTRVGLPFSSGAEVRVVYSQHLLWWLRYLFLVSANAISLTTSQWLLCRRNI